MFDQKEPSQNFVPLDNLPPPPPVAPQSSTPQPPKIEDMFAETDSGNPQIIRPLRPGQVQNILPDSGLTEDPFGGRSIWQSKFLVIFIVVGILILGGVGWATFGYFSKSVKSNQNINNAAANANVNAVNTNAANTNADVNAVNTNNNVNTNVNAAIEPVDSDSDGLTDQEEATLGTDPRNFDTDADGLPDRAEVKIYKTDPLNPDTDGDSYKDGAEVISGYDPLKSGGARLYDIPKQ